MAEGFGCGYILVERAMCSICRLCFNGVRWSEVGYGGCSVMVHRWLRAIAN